MNEAGIGTVAIAAARQIKAPVNATGEHFWRESDAWISNHRKGCNATAPPLKRCSAATAASLQLLPDGRVS
jgi:hypothetical protein